MTDPLKPESTQGQPGKPGWERSLLERLALEWLKEQRRSRRWGIFFKLFFAGYLLLIVLLAVDWGGPGVGGRYTALVDLDGVIEADGLASADNVISGLRAAFAAKGTAGVILRANSPGGSPVQSSYINDEIGRLREEYPDIPIYAVVTDICASGCYYVVAAADKIYASKASIVGSIGVLMDGFGFVDAMKKLGIERRLLTAGESKGFLDPFSPVKPEDRRFAQKLLRDIHEQFIADVKADRGHVLASGNKQLFSGLVWTGDRAKGLGLVDEFGSASYVAREVIGAEDIVDFTRHPDLFQRFAERIGVAMGKGLASEMAVRSPVLK